jgi:hypothetical protein
MTNNGCVIRGDGMESDYWMELYLNFTLNTAGEELSDK